MDSACDSPSTRLTAARRRLSFETSLTHTVLFLYHFTNLHYLIHACTNLPFTDFNPAHGLQTTQHTATRHRISFRDIKAAYLCFLCQLLHSSACFSMLTQWLTRFKHRPTLHITATSFTTFTLFLSPTSYCRCATSLFYVYSIWLSTWPTTFKTHTMTDRIYSYFYSVLIQHMSYKKLDASSLFEKRISFLTFFVCCLLCLIWGGIILPYSTESLQAAPPPLRVLPK